MLCNDPHELNDQKERPNDYKEEYTLSDVMCKLVFKPPNYKNLRKLNGCNALSNVHNFATARGEKGNELEQNAIFADIAPKHNNNGY